MQGLSSDRVRYHCCHQMKRSGRIFIGGDRGKVSELTLEIESADKGSFITRAIRATASRIVGAGSKMRKVDKSVDSSILQKILGGFFDTSAGRTRVVMDITED